MAIRTVPSVAPRFFFTISVYQKSRSAPKLGEQPLRDVDFEEFEKELRNFKPPGILRLGGDRAMLLKLDVHIQRPQRDERILYSVEGWVARTEDDPFPSISWLMFDIDEFWHDTADKTQALIRSMED